MNPGANGLAVQIAQRLNARSRRVIRDPGLHPAAVVVPVVSGPAGPKAARTRGLLR